LAVAFGIAFCAGSTCRAAREYHCLNGIQARIYTPEELLASYIDTVGTRIFLDHPATGRVELVTGPDDPRVVRETVRFYPFDAELVRDALAAMHGFETDVRTEVFILPLLPLPATGSYSEGHAIVLAPGFGPVPAATVHYITTHEMGHVLTVAFLDGSPSRWSSYLTLRGLAAVTADAGLPHRERPREILAEDIRHLFGGPLATYNGTIENARLPLPENVPGLAELLATFFGQTPVTHVRLIASRPYPNPCNPATTIRMELPADFSPLQASETVLRVYDVRGRLIRAIRGGDAVDGAVVVHWDGSDERGSPAASGHYLYRLSLDWLESRGALILVR
jgi:hypothetical protein